MPVWGFVLGCWASASDTVRTGGARAKLKAARPKTEKALRREIISVSFFSVTFNSLRDCCVAVESTVQSQAGVASSRTVRLRFRK